MSIQIDENQPHDKQNLFKVYLGKSFQLTPVWANFHCCKWPNFENTIWSSGHTGPIHRRLRQIVRVVIASKKLLAFVMQKLKNFLNCRFRISCEFYFISQFRPNICATRKTTTTTTTRRVFVLKARSTSDTN